MISDHENGKLMMLDLNSFNKALKIILGEKIFKGK